MPGGPAKNARSKMVVVPTCDRDAAFKDLCIEGIRKFWPEVPVFEFHDARRDTETDVPDDIRALCRTTPHLRKQIDLPFLFDGIDDLYIVDCDCFFFARPDEFIQSYSYQGHTLRGHPDYPWGLEVWAHLGYRPEIVRPLFCDGLFSAPRTMWLYNRWLMFDYLRACVQRGYHDKTWHYSAVTLDQSMVSGLWRLACPDNPLPALEYPLGIPTVPMKVFHACYFKRKPEFPLFLEDYKRHLSQ